ncbi:MAG: helix-turn-helix domain-containing protein [Methylococcales bacterium]
MTTQTTPQNRTSAAIAATLLTETQLAERWAMSVKTLQAWRERGNGLAFIKLGKAVRYRLTDIEDFEVKNLKTNTSMT